MIDVAIAVLLVILAGRFLADAIICWHCKEGGIDDGGDTFPVTHAEDCKAKQAEAALETLRKMATGVI